MKTLKCKIVSISGDYMSKDFEYTVYDENKLVANGVSSSRRWVKHDAGGYHTKEKFDKLYPGGWEVTFEELEENRLDFY